LTGCPGEVGEGIGEVGHLSDTVKYPGTMLTRGDTKKGERYGGA
jgi:hypothetical protein